VKKCIEGAVGIDPDLAAVCRAGLVRVPLERGFVDIEPSTPVARRNGVLCVALGQPRFGGGASQDGSPAWTWIDLYERHGIDAPAYVRGRFATLIEDERRRRVVLSVDRFGTLPMCFAIHDAYMAFANRADRVPIVDRKISNQALFDYFYFHVIPAPRTAFESVERLLGAHALIRDAGKARLHRYWMPAFSSEHTDLGTAKLQFRQLVRESVQREADGGLAVGAFLSGGTDSSTIAGMLTQVANAPAKTYSIGFDVGGYDEMAYARIAAKHFGTDHHEYYVTPADVVAGLPHIARHGDQPFGNSSLLPAWHCTRLAHEDGVAKMLAGDGGDELFGGNVRYAKQRVFGWYEGIPPSVRRLFVEPVLGTAGLSVLPLFRKGKSYVDQARVPMPDRTEMYNLLGRLGLDHVFTPAFKSAVNADAPRVAQRETWEAIQATTMIDRMLAFDWKYTLTDNDLPKVVGAAELAGIDVCFPLLADELVDFSMRLPAQWKLKGLTLRWFFKEALRDFLPAEIIAKKKHGFGLPFGRWVVTDGPLGSLVRQSLYAFESRNVIRPEFLRELMEQRMLEHPGYYGELVWLIAVAEHWLQAHDADWKLTS
jgi:asparagine synthase (glutamine-hydrolysing)